MINRQNIIADVEKYKIVVIIRGLDREQLFKTVKALIDGGIRFVEITFDQTGKVSNDETAKNIKELKVNFGDKLHVGAGTVMTKKQVKLAYQAGAEFIISPDCNKRIIKYTKKLGLLSMPGAFTPTEAAEAHRYGADFVKLFPNSEVKSSYLKALIAPLAHIKFLAVGGISLENINEYLDAGAVGVGIGSLLVNKEWIKNGEFYKFTETAKLLTDKINS